MILSGHFVRYTCKHTFSNRWMKREVFCWGFYLDVDPSDQFKESCWFAARDSRWSVSVSFVMKLSKKPQKNKYNTCVIHLCYTSVQI